jgi:hypothetical protein
LIFQVRLDLVFVFNVEGDRAVDSYQRARHGKRPQNGLGGLAGLEGADYAIERNPRSGDVISALAFVDVLVYDPKAPTPVYEGATSAGNSCRFWAGSQNRLTNCPS